MHLANRERYTTMQYAHCGNSGLQLPRVVLGLWHNFGAQDSYANARDMLCAAFDAGITQFDLANNYGPPAGSAEETLGRVLQRELRGYRDELVISTKAGYTMWDGPYGDHGSRKHLMASLDQSLRRLGLDYVDIFYHHRPDADTPPEESMGALADMVKSGKALYVGLSNYGPQETRRAAQLLAAQGVHCLVHQMRYSLLDRTNEASIDAAQSCGMGTVAFSPLAQGILTGKYANGIPQGSRAAGGSPFLRSDNLTSTAVEKANELAKIAAARGETLAQFALAWVLRAQRGVTSVIIGAHHVPQITENLGCVHAAPFTDAQLAEIDAVLGGYTWKK